MGHAIDEDAFLAAFLQRVAGDRAAGVERGLDDYLAEFDTRAELVRRAWAELSGEVTIGAADEVPEVAARARGEALGPYRLLSVLGAGGQGEVWLAEDPRLGRRVAIKVLRGMALAVASLNARFRREAEIASRLDHPGICPIYDSGVERGVPYIVMRYVEGRTLGRHLERWRAPASTSTTATVAERPVAPPDAQEVLFAAAVVEKVARAAHAAHESGVLHRDLKPGNIMVSADGEPVILDFGIARFVEGDDSLRTLTGELFGTPAYLAPEQLRTPPAAPDRRIDVYSLGVTLFESVTGRRPFEAPTRDALWQQILREEPSDPRRINPAVAPDLRAIVLTAIEKEPDRRYQTALDLADDLRRFREHEPIRARTPGPVERLRRWARRDPMRAAFVALLFIVTAAGGFALARWPGVREALRQKDERQRAERMEELLARGFAAVFSPDVYGNPRPTFDEARELDPSSVEAVVGRVLCEFIDRDPAAARRILDAAPAAMQPDPVVDYARRMTEWPMEEGSRRVRADLAAEPPATAFGFFLGSVLAADQGTAGDLAAGRRALDLIGRCLMIAERPRLPYHAQLAHAARAAGDYATVKRAVDALMRLWPATPFTLEIAARSLNECDPQGALRYARRLAEHDQGVRTRTMLAQALANAGFPEEAIEVAKATAAEFPDASDIRFILGHACDVAGRKEDARAAYEDAVRVDPRNQHAQHNLGCILRDLDRDAEALPHLQEAVRLVPVRAESWQALANLYIDAGDYERGEDAVLRALQWNPEFASAHNTLGSLRQRMKRFAESEKAYREALRLDPGYVIAASNLARLFARIGRPQEALEMAAHARDLAAAAGTIANVAESIESAERQLAALKLLEDAVRDGTLPEDVDEAGGVAEAAERRGSWAAAAWAWGELIERERRAGPAARPDFESRAARAALHAARGDGDAAGLDPATRARFAAEALARLEATAAVFEKAVEAGSVRETILRKWSESLTADEVFQGLRDGRVAAAAGGALAVRNRALWARIDALREEL